MYDNKLMYIKRINKHKHKIIVPEKIPIFGFEIFSNWNNYITKSMNDITQTNRVIQTELLKIQDSKS